MLAIDPVGTNTVMYRVSDVLKPDFARSWNEAVAIVQEVASQFMPGASVPGPDDLLLDQDGTLQLGFGPDSPQDPVSALGSLLQSLLTGIEAPGGLRDLANDNAKPSPALSSVAALQRALAFYERPARANDLQAIATRLRAEAGAPTAVDPAAEFEKLREKVAAKVEARHPTEPETVKKKRISRKTMVIAAVAELALLGAIVAYARPQYLGAAGTLTDRVEQTLANTISGGLNKIGMTNDSRVASAPLPAEAPEATRGPARPAARAATPGAATRGAATPGVATPPGGTSFRKPRARSPIPTPPLARAPIPTPTLTLVMKGQLPAAADGGDVMQFVHQPDMREVDASAPGDNVEPARLDGDGLVTFSSADADVQPPRLNRPQLPRQPEPGDDTGYFDVVVSEAGHVERVQLISPMRRFQERMLMAAAKAWQFRPAMRNGLPVRYRMRIAIILSDKP